MPIVSVRIPQLGEGLQEALLVELLKQPGDSISRDEPIYTMETDKATTDVESPYSGTLIEWLAEPHSVLQIGAEIARVEVAAGVKETPAAHGSTPAPVSSPSSASVPASVVSSASRSKPLSRQSDERTVLIPPKTRRLLQQHGLLEMAAQIPHMGNKLMPSDVEAYLAEDGAAISAADDSVANAAATPKSSSTEIPAATSEHYETRPLPKSQIVLNYRMGRGAKSCVPVTAMSEIEWTAINFARDSVRGSGGPSGFAMVCWCVVQAMKDHERFRSVLAADGNSLKIFHRVNLGVAVGLRGHEMVTAVIDDADQKSQTEFFEAYQAAVLSARDGNDQATESTTLTVSNIGGAGIRMGIPAIVAPAMATLAIGEIYSHPIPASGDDGGFQFVSSVMVTMSFDHRIVNGVGAANFLSSIKHNVEGFGI
jgi:pyruvate/2-oxoglutarate dehydrogenase complex dihydrolipoamide acyltransferase (E2) component